MDATLMFLTESAEHPELARLAQSAYDELADGREVSYGLLADILGTASAKGVLRSLHRKYSATACDAILMPICREIDRLKPVPPRRRTAGEQGVDPLTAPLSDLF